MQASPPLPRPDTLSPRQHAGGSFRVRFSYVLYIRSKMPCPITTAFVPLCPIGDAELNGIVYVYTKTRLSAEQQASGTTSRGLQGGAKRVVLAYLTRADQCRAWSFGWRGTS
jgi:hypothetical protein